MSQIRLRKTNKTIKLVNRRENIRLKKEENTISLKRTGGVGPKGDTGVSTFVRVHHQTNPSVARPDAYFVEWVGSVPPLNATTEDTWIDTA